MADGGEWVVFVAERMARGCCSETMFAHFSIQPWVRVVEREGMEMNGATRAHARECRV